MIVQWMAYAALCAALFAGAAVCVERVCASRGRARRGVWLAAIVLSVVVPAASPWTARTIGVAAPEFAAAVPATSEPAQPVSSPAQLDIIALTAWATASLLFATLLFVAHWRTNRVLRGCRRDKIADRPAFISQDFGPAVVGVFRHHIVVPEWVLALGESEQQFIVMHELEHARSSDPVVALAGVCAVIAMPWNVALWWQLARLRLAIEVDCDARVVARKRSDVIAYGQLLLCVRERGQARRHPVLALSHSRSSLAKRLDALLDRRTRQNAGQLVALATLAICVAGSVAFIPAPQVQTVIRELRKSRVEAPVAVAGILTRTPETTPVTTSATVAAAPAAARPVIRQRAATPRPSTRSNAQMTALAQTAVPPMSVVPSNPLGLVGPATAPRIVSAAARGGFARSGGGGGAVLRASPGGGRGGGGGGGAMGRGGFQPTPPSGALPDSTRGGVIRAAGARAAIVPPKPDTTQQLHR